mmetsp:Transcript_25516/g.39171  ORF Transcript_25516/g.39171 Transcript_25516/m.39171 type:complete len:502 (+) Transcript_25516:62-1567(+)|eukprot:CAMPEP_0118699144 /NCGR_PEP_ID=MMETSP0800-20121206/15694_1 /TAXON_ID=210618 ORGANISM="Striatella unipunctata, Strain CCMP2910" /NCGR_SAMPLE_ID=MMETSP0800 /ASSEMBLY_ACC=CAM_ASM_000638 /LENGTH=501 /DNA_ID=CAMNT_0006599245 /DNA_START=31 /DNA_END=1536 /DNA_ORIENTATION=-
MTQDDTTNQQEWQEQQNQKKAPNTPPKKKSPLRNLFRRRRKNNEGDDNHEDEFENETPVTTPERKGDVKSMMAWELETEQAVVMYEAFSEDPLEALSMKSTQELPTPDTPEDVVVRVKASTISLNDCKIRMGLWYDTLELPETPGFDCAGTVETVGSNVTKFVEGDRVVGLIRTGGNARFLSVPESRLITVPEGINSDEAVSIVSVYAAAYQALYRARPEEEEEDKQMLPSLENKSILITGGNGPIGYATIQLAFLGGAKIYATSIEKYHEVLKAAGAIPLPFDDWLPEVEGQMDLVIDSVCEDEYESPRMALNPTGHLVATGINPIILREDPGCFVPTAQWVDFKARYLMGSTTLYDVWTSSIERPQMFRYDVELLMDIVKTGQLKPTIAKQVSLSDVGQAQWDLENGLVDAGGILVCKPWKALKRATPPPPSQKSEKVRSEIQRKRSIVKAKEDEKEEDRLEEEQTSYYKDKAETRGLCNVMLVSDPNGTLKEKRKKKR